jgi:hypothetical protein
VVSDAVFPILLLRASMSAPSFIKCRCLLPRYGTRLLLQLNAVNAFRTVRILLKTNYHSIHAFPCHFIILILIVHNLLELHGRFKMKMYSDVRDRFHTYQLITNIETTVYLQSRKPQLLPVTHR